MSKPALKRLALATIAGIAGVIAAPSLALASCIAPPPFPEAIQDAPAVFVGTVIDLEGGGRWATVEITDVWTGGDLPAEVEVRGGPRNTNMVTSVDRHFELSREYLFVPFRRSGSVFRDNACTRTTLFHTELTRFHPDSASEESPTPSPEIPPTEVEGNGTPWLLLGAALLASALIALALLRRG